MLRVVGLTLMLLGVAWLGCQVENPIRSALVASEQAPQAEQWVRTVDGWESKRDWKSDVVRPPMIHPVVIALGQMFVSVMALVAFCPTLKVAEDEPQGSKSSWRAARSTRPNSMRTIVATYR